MDFFKKKISPQKLRNIIYTNIRYSIMTPDTSLSYEVLFKKLEENHNKLPPFYIFELLIGLLFGALQAIEKKYHYPIAGEIPFLETPLTSSF